VREQKKHVFGCEGTVAGKGSQTLAFVSWAFYYFFVFLQQICHCRGLFLGLLATRVMRSCFFY